MMESVQLLLFQFGWASNLPLDWQQAKMSDAEWLKKLLLLLDNEPFRAISQMGLVESTNYTAVKSACDQDMAKAL